MRTRVGYCGGTTDSPTYRNIGDHAETLEFDYNPQVISYTELLRHFFTEHRPIRPPYSRQYMSAIFCKDETELALAEQAKTEAGKRFGSKVYTEVACGMPFYRAEDYHQKYRLLRYEEVCSFLQKRYGSFDGFVDAPTSARLNAYVTGQLGRKRFDEEKNSFALDLPSLRILEKSIRP